MFRVSVITSWRHSRFLGAVLQKLNGASSPSPPRPVVEHYRYISYPPGNSLIGVNDYEYEKKTFKMQVPEKFNFARDVIDKFAQESNAAERNETALWWINDQGREVKWSFSELSTKSKKVANILETSCGLKEGDVILVLLGRNPEWWLFSLASLRCGIVMSPGTMLLTSHDINYRLKMSKAKCIITDESLADSVDKACVGCPDLKLKLLVSEKSRSGWLNYYNLFDEVSEHHDCLDTKSSDPSILYFTSGTTGAPKMAQHTHASLGIGHQATARFIYDAHQSDVVWGISDPGWAKTAFSALFGTWVSGCCSFIYSTEKFDSKKCLQVLCKYPVTVFCAPPTGYRSFVKEDLKSYDFKALRHCVSAGEPLNPEVVESWVGETGLPIYEGYGQTETGAIASTMRCMELRPGSFGKAVPGVDMAIIDENGNELPIETEGDIGLKYKPERPVQLFEHYLNDDALNERSYRGDYFLLGDRGKIDKDGYIWFIGRADDVMISSGYRIGPFEVESALIEHDAVLESAVVSSPDPDRGEVVKAFIVLTPQYEKYEDKEGLKKDIQNHVKQVAAPYKYPRKIEFVADLPKTISGKIRRIELRKKEWEKKTPQN
ncbi:acyl-coenzyme A synthetase ACSM3, mitochondrial-like isoform X2 [Tubulanus polymorphus]